MGELVQFVALPPKTKSGSRRNVSWRITYSRETRSWEWEVTVQLTPQVFRGTSPSEAAAQAEVDKYLTTMTA